MHSPVPRLGLAIMVLLMLTAATGPAPAAADAVPATNSPSDSPRLLRTPSADNPMPSDSSSVVDQPPLPGDIMNTINRSGSNSSTSSASSSSSADNTAAFGSKLRPYEQCGGDGGFCNSTTIGVPCGDHVWNGVVCPTYYYCARQNYTSWTCRPQPPDVVKAAQAAQAQHTARVTNTTRQTNPSKYNVTQLNDIGSDGQFSASAAVGDSNRSRASTTSGDTLVLDRDSISPRQQTGAAGQQLGPAYVLTGLMLLLAAVGSVMML